MTYQAPEAKVNLARRVHHRTVELCKRHHQLWLALHRQHTVGREPQGAEEKVKVRLKLWRGLGRQGLHTGQDWQGGHKALFQKLA